VASLLARRRSFCEEVRREQTLGEVVDPPVPLAPGKAQDARLREGLEDGPDRVRRPPVPVDRGPWLKVGRRQRAIASDPFEQLLDERSVDVERRPVVLVAVLVPGDRYHGNSRVGTIERPLLYVSYSARDPYRWSSVQARR
jgi:hypothetical protein